MVGRSQASLALAGTLILAACGEKASEAPTAPEFATDCMSVSLMPHTSRSRARFALGRSGSAAFSSSTQAGSGAIGTRSGSGK